MGRFWELRLWDSGFREAIGAGEYRPYFYISQKHSSTDFLKHGYEAFCNFRPIPGTFGT